MFPFLEGSSDALDNSEGDESEGKTLPEPSVKVLTETATEVASEVDEAQENSDPTEASGDEGDRPKGRGTETEEEQDEDEEEDAGSGNEDPTGSKPADSSELEEEVGSDGASGSERDADIEPSTAENYDKESQIPSLKTIMEKLREVNEMISIVVSKWANSGSEEEVTEANIDVAESISDDDDESILKIKENLTTLGKNEVSNEIILNPSPSEYNKIEDETVTEAIDKRKRHKKKRRHRRQRRIRRRH